MFNARQCRDLGFDKGFAAAAVKTADIQFYCFEHNFVKLENFPTNLQIKYKFTNTG